MSCCIKLYVLNELVLKEPEMCQHGMSSWCHSGTPVSKQFLRTGSVVMQKE